MGTLRLLLIGENNLRHGVIPALFSFLWARIGCLVREVVRPTLKTSEGVV